MLTETLWLPLQREQVTPHATDPPATQAQKPGELSCGPPGPCRWCPWGRDLASCSLPWAWPAYPGVSCAVSAGRGGPGRCCRPRGRKAWSPWTASSPCRCGGSVSGLRPREQVLPKIVQVSSGLRTSVSAGRWGAVLTEGAVRGQGQCGVSVHPVNVALSSKTRGHVRSTELWPSWTHHERLDGVVPSGEDGEPSPSQSQRRLHRERFLSASPRPRRGTSRTRGALIAMFRGSRGPEGGSVVELLALLVGLHPC